MEWKMVSKNVTKIILVTNMFVTKFIVNGYLASNTLIATCATHTDLTDWSLVKYSEM